MLKVRGLEIRSSIYTIYIDLSMHVHVVKDYEGAHRGTKLDAGRTTHAYIIIYKEDFAQQYDKCGARSGSPHLCTWQEELGNDTKVT